LVQGELTGLDHQQRTATITAGDTPPREVDYDTVVLALGSVTRLFPVPGLVEHAVGFQTLSEAIHLRNQVLSRVEAADATDDPEVRRRALTFVFVGAGYAGVEALAELEDLARSACRDYPSVSPDDLHWVLIEATDRILPSMDERLARRTSAQLQARGVEIRLNTQLRSVDHEVIELSDGAKLSADTLVWMPGVQPNPVAGRLDLPCDDQGRLRADRFLRVESTDDAWTAGDVARIPDGHGGTFPPTAQHAQREARHLAENIARALHGEPLQPFSYRSRGEFVTLGSHKGVARVQKLHLKGTPAWLLRRIYYLTQIPSRERRVRLLADWAVGLPFPTDITQLGSAEHPDRPLDDAARGA
jgi:NADH dehydrogenase